MFQCSVLVFQRGTVNKAMIKFFKITHSTLFSFRSFTFFFLVPSIAWNPILILCLCYPDAFNYSQINFWFNSFKPTHSTLFPFSFFFLVSSIAWNPILILCLCHPDTTTIPRGSMSPEQQSTHILNHTGVQSILKECRLTGRLCTQKLIEIILRIPTSW